METEKGSQKPWSNTQAYGLAVICLLLGGASGYLIHGSATAKAPAVAPAVVQQQLQQATPAVTETAKPTPEQMKHMADKTTEPLFAKLKENPNDPDLLAQIGKAYLYTHQFEPAVEFYEKSVKIKPDPRVLTTLGGVYHFTGSDDKALETWNRALRIDPSYADALFNVGLVQWQAKSDPKAAIATWQKLLKAHPQHKQRARIEALIARAQNASDIRNSK